MAYKQKELTGSLFRNDKDGVETRPDYTGSILVDGKKLWLSGWINKPDGKPAYISLKLKFADEAPRVSNGGAPMLDDEVQFAPDRN